MTDSVDFEIKEFLESLQDQIIEGLHDDMTLKGEIDVELSIVTNKEAGGKVRVFVVDAGGKYEKETISKVKFKIRPKMENVGLATQVKNKKLRG